MSSLQIRMTDKYYLKKNSKIVLKKYEVGDKIGQGSHSTVYAIMFKSTDCQKIRALKVVQSYNIYAQQSQKVKQPQISKEVSIIKKIFADQPQVIGFPKLYQYGFESDFNYMVIKLLGPSLAQLNNVCGGVFSMKTTIYVGLQILDRIQKLHNLGYLYVDIKPQNFLVGLGQNSPFIYMIDFGRCQLYKNKKNGSHIPYRQSQNNIFDQALFSSINCHNGIQYSRRDDIESFIYMLIFLTKGRLPWDNVQSKSRSEKLKKIFQIKKKVTPQNLLKGLSIHLSDLIWYSRTLSFYQKPDYQYIRHKLYNCLDQNQIQTNEICYDWTNSQEFNYKGLVTIPKISLISEVNNFTHQQQQKEKKKQSKIDFSLKYDQKQSDKNDYPLKKSKNVIINISVNKKIDQKLSEKTQQKIDQNKKQTD